MEGKPFVGPSGQIVRQTLRWAGIDPKREVRFTNCVRHNPGSFPSGAAGAQLLRADAAKLDREIERMSDLHVIVACGSQALLRLTGQRNITKWRGSVLRNEDLPDVLRWHPKVDPWVTRYPEQIYIVPVLHPAGIMRSGGRDDMILLRRDLHKVNRLLNGKLQPVDFNLLLHPRPQHLVTLAKRSKRVFIDTEFKPDTKQVFWVGLTFDGHDVYGMPWTPDYAAALQAVLGHVETVTAHYITADIEALEASGGVQVKAKWFDTLVAMHALHPALEVGLDDAARFYLDDVKQWKDMDHTDPAYNARDVAYGWAVMEAELEEARSRAVNPMPEIEARMRLLPVTHRMMTRGMQVDVAQRNKMIERVGQEAAKLVEEIEEQVKPRWDKRVRAARQALFEAEELHNEIRTAMRGLCTVHPTFNGLRKPAATCETCRGLYEEAADLRARYAEAKKQRLRAKAEVARWEKGFKANNNEHLRWLLYDPEHGLKLPVQRAVGTRQPTANRAAIDKLVTLRTVQRNAAAFEVVRQIKQVQQLEKARSTFLQVPLDEQFVAHPTYKIHGTRTGRLAGGKDHDERSDNRYAFNALNIPREWRSMYIPPSGCVFVAADWRNVEGRLTAYFCRDSAYQRALDGELRGGPKVHALNASIIYGIDPGEAKDRVVKLGGLDRTAYDAGKRLTHAWSYGMKPPKMSSTFNIELREAVRIDEKLSLAYPQLVRWRTQLVDKVLGVWEPNPATGKKACVLEGQRLLANPFGWQLHFLGVEASQANEVIAFLPQSTGAGLWTRCAPQLEARYPIYTGTYDSFVLIVPNGLNDVREARTYIVEVMEQRWTTLEERSFPCEVSVGFNLGGWSKSNPRGLKEVD